MLSQTAEYALRSTAALASSGDALVPTSDLAKLADVPPPYLAKVLQQLSGAEIIRGRRGVGGGYTLNREAADITLLEVVSAVGPLRPILTESEREELGDGLASLRGVIDGAATDFRKRLDRTTLADIAQDRSKIRDTSPDTLRIPTVESRRTGETPKNGTFAGQ